MTSIDARNNSFPYPVEKEELTSLESLEKWFTCTCQSIASSVHSKRLFERSDNRTSWIFNEDVLPAAALTFYALCLKITLLRSSQL